MLISDICIRRPVFATVLSLVIVLVGAVSYTRLSVREYPRIDTPVVTVTTTYTGASAEVIETQVTKPLEDSIAGIRSLSRFAWRKTPTRQQPMCATECPEFGQGCRGP